LEQLVPGYSRALPNAQPGDQFRYTKDGNIYVNTGHGFTAVGRDRDVANTFAALFRIRAESDKGIVFSAPSDAQKAGEAPSVDPSASECGYTRTRQRRSRRG